jgi:hypothetical protein
MAVPMTRKFLLDVSPTGVEHHVEIAHDGDEMTLVEHTPSSVEAEILDSCASLRSLHQRRGAGLQHAARIPINTYTQWKKEWREKWADVYTWPTFEVMKLNSRDNCNLRTGQSSGAFGKRL